MNFQQNFLSSLAGGLQIGQQIKQQRDTSQINRLAGLAYGADPGQRESLIGQMHQINPQMAAQQEQGMAMTDERRNRTMVNMARMLTGAPEQARAGIYRQMVPTLSRFGMSELPQEYNAQTAPIIDKAAQSIMQALQGAGGNNVQSTYINAEGKRVAIMRDGSQQVLGDANQSIRVLEQEGALPYGVVTSGGVAGQVVPLGGGQPQAQPAGTYIDPSLPPEVQAQIRQSLAAGQEPPSQMVFAGGAGASGPVRTPTAGEKAAATERARQEVQLQYLPQQQAIETQGAIDRAVGTERGKAQVEREAAAPGAISTMEQAVSAIDELLGSADLGNIVGWGSVNPLNRLPNRPERGLIARAEQIGGQAFLAAFNQLKGGGAITEREGAAATAAMARLDRSQSLEDYQTALRDLRSAIAPALERQRSVMGGQQQGDSQQGAAIRIQSADDYSRLPSGAIYIAPDGMQRRKR